MDKKQWEAYMEAVKSRLGAKDKGHPPMDQNQCPLCVVMTKRTHSDLDCGDCPAQIIDGDGFCSEVCGASGTSKAMPMLRRKLAQLEGK